MLVKSSLWFEVLYISLSQTFVYCWVCVSLRDVPTLLLCQQNIAQYQKLFCKHHTSVHPACQFTYEIMWRFLRSAASQANLECWSWWANCYISVYNVLCQHRKWQDSSGGCIAWNVVNLYCIVERRPLASDRQERCFCWYLCPEV